MSTLLSFSTDFGSDFPILNQTGPGGARVVYLDSAATSLCPVPVLKAMEAYYHEYNANIHRGIYRYAEQATAAYEDARTKTAAFIGSRSAESIVFTRNATEAINLVAFSYGRTFLKPGDVIIATEMEHHANMVPWQALAAERELKLKYVPLTDDGRLDLNSYGKLLELNPKLVALTHMSNVLGTINPVHEMIRQAHDAGALVILDVAQSAAHLSLNVQDLNVDFAALSAHKMCGPTGIGVLYAKSELLDRMPPFLTGGDMIREVHLERYTLNDIPHKFEAGTPAIAEAIGFGAAIDYLNQLGMENIHHHEKKLTAHAMQLAESTPGMRVLGPSLEHRGGLLSFTLDGIHPHDIAQILDDQGVAVRAGHHCAMPVHERFHIPASARASFYLYSTDDDVDRLFTGIHKAREIFS